MPRTAASAHDLVRTAPLATDDPLSLPDVWTPSARPGIPIVAAFAPVLGGVAIWLVTGSTLALWLAGLGPLLAAGTMLDGVRTRRRDRRRAGLDAARARAAVVDEIVRRHDGERSARWRERPDVAHMLTSDAGVWRADASGAEALVVGAGVQPSSVSVTGGRGDAEAARVRTDAARLTHAPVTVPWRAGVAVAGDAFAAHAVVRALAAQICLAAPPGDVRLIGALSEHAWAERLPHRRAAQGLALALVAPGEPVPAETDILLARVASGDPPPPRCGVLLHVRGLGSGSLDSGGQVQQVELEAVGAVQAAAIAAMLEERAGVAFGRAAATDPIAFEELHRAGAPATGTLAATIGRGDRGPVSVDLVEDGPHAVVAGVTGAGKSELLITWILALCAAHGTGTVSFLLADFKGGTAFDALRALPHVTGVITDLDDAGARRAIESLRAEIRWRERALAAAGARDIADPGVRIPRLVVVVDEFAALLSAQPELHAVFSDVAARGRALGMHLILGTQRTGGVVRDALLNNCPLRMSLRVTDRADSRAVIGSDDAAELPGGAHGRGVALVRRAADAAAQRVRIALSAPDDITAVAAASAGAAPRRPWLPALPELVRLDELNADQGSGRLVLGLSDEPERQLQRAVAVAIADRGLLVVGGPGSGRTTALETLTAQAAEVVRVGPEPECAWDALVRLEEAPPDAGAVVVADDLDGLVGRFPPEYAQEFVEGLERVARAAGRRGVLVVAATQRLSGPVARIADVLPRRLLLPMPSRADHFGAGGDPARFSAGAPSGRGTLDGTTVQVAVAPRRASRSEEDESPWHPVAPLTGFVARRSPAARDAVAAWEHEGAHVIGLAAFARDGHPGEPAVVTGDPDEWQRQWRVLGEVRADHDLVVDASCAGEMRLLTGSRGLPPYAEPGRGRAWLMTAGSDARRIVLPTPDPRPHGGDPSRR